MAGWTNHSGANPSRRWGGWVPGWLAGWLPTGSSGKLQRACLQQLSALSSSRGTRAHLRQRVLLQEDLQPLPGHVEDKHLCLGHCCRLPAAHKEVGVKHRQAAPKKRKVTVLGLGTVREMPLEDGQMIRMQSGRRACRHQGQRRPCIAPSPARTCPGTLQSCAQTPASGPGCRPCDSSSSSSKGGQQRQAAGQSAPCLQACHHRPRLHAAAPAACCLLPAACCFASRH